MALVAAAAYDAAHAHPDAEARKQNQAFYEFLVPLVKGYSTEMSLEVASLGVQVHGGMGFIEETGAAQYLRDAKILTIYEGTTAIQANDLVGRKTARDGGAVAQGDRGADRNHRRRAGQARQRARRTRCSSACARRARRSSTWSTSSSSATKDDPNAVFAGSVPYLMLAGNLMAGWQMARALLVAEERLAAGERRRFHARQDRHRALLRRPHPEPGAGRARQHRRGRSGRDRHGLGGLLNMALPPVLAKLPLPIIGAPLFIISNPKLVIAQCKAGIVGSMPALNARPAAQLDEWLAEITETLAA